MTAMTLRPYDETADAALAFDLWTQCLGNLWPLSRDAFTGRRRTGIVAVAEGRLAGVALTCTVRGTGHLQALLVAARLQRRDIGSALHRAAYDAFVNGGAQTIQLGGGSGYFWPGLPRNLFAVREFFEHLGWAFDGSCWDLMQNLKAYATPAGIVERAQAAGVECRLAHSAEMPDVVQLEERHFPAWVDYFRAASHDRAVVAVDRAGHIVGALLIELPTDGSVIWTRLLGHDAGAIGAVGVDPGHEGRGIGTAMVARACELLREVPVGNCHVGWTSLLTFYGRLGFRPWREYLMSSRTVPPAGL